MVHEARRSARMARAWCMRQERDSVTARAWCTRQERGSVTAHARCTRRERDSVVAHARCTRQEGDSKRVGAWCMDPEAHDNLMSAGTQIRAGSRGRRRSALPGWFPRLPGPGRKGQDGGHGQRAFADGQRKPGAAHGAVATASGRSAAPRWGCRIPSADTAPCPPRRRGRARGSRSLPFPRGPRSGWCRLGRAGGQ